MKRLKSFLFVAAAAVGLLAASSARADIGWHADWSPSNLAITAGPSTVIGFTNLVNSGYITTTLQPVITTPVTNTYIITTAGSPDTVNAHYALSLVLKDDLSGLTHPFSFGGTLSGLVSLGGASLSNVFDAPSTQDFTFANGNHYVVTLNGFVPPGSGQNVNTQGAIGADITATTGEPPDNGHIHDSPEPSTMALAGLGMAFTGLMVWRRRRNAIA